MTAPFGPDGRAVVVAVDHPLYSWPCRGLEDRASVIRSAVDGGADAVIAAYGTVRDLAEAFGEMAAIMKLDLTTVAVGGEYPLTEYVVAYSVDDAIAAGAAAVLSFVQLGADFELEALRTAGRIAAASDRAGMPYVCEIMPVESVRFPDPHDPLAITAATRTAVELGARVVKTSIPTPPEAIVDAAAFGVPVIVAGGDLTDDRATLFDAVTGAMDHGASGVAFGRNVWGAPDPAGTVRELARIVHGSTSDRVI
jgi:DhnA family fructose-bisphosphate aldolase class Ia